MITVKRQFLRSCQVTEVFGNSKDVKKFAAAFVNSRPGTVFNFRKHGDGQSRLVLESPRVMGERVGD